MSVAPNNAGVVPNLVPQGLYPRGRVTVTPLSVKPSQNEVAASVTVPGVKKVLLKAVNKENGKDSKLFTLRNIQQMTQLHVRI